MKVTFHYSKRDPSNSLELSTTQELQKLEKFFRGEALIDVYFKADGKSHTMKVIGLANGNNYAVQSKSADMYNNIDACMQKFRTQLIKSKADYRTDSRKVNQKRVFSDKHNMEQYVPMTELE